MTSIVAHVFGIAAIVLIHIQDGVGDCLVASPGLSIVALVLINVAWGHVHVCHILIDVIKCVFHHQVTKDCKCVNLLNINLLWILKVVRRQLLFHHQRVVSPGISRIGYLLHLLGSSSASVACHPVILSLIRRISVSISSSSLNT